ncbi:SusC/RagA family TonB-linked outer membrane protein [Nitritalea halalkaliphila]|uniref:TonB-dependent receptor n=1 Tax=Nitritalea halalkaliphila TaxID=590849 RepID=UPI0002E3EA28|nr:TonB-dependent receptor [Nitritalea halalkaliphila]
MKYNFQNKLTVNGTLRYDGSSRFGVDNRWGLFPSIGAAYVLSEEGFLKDSRFLEDLKLRASIGTAGNNRIDNFASRALISSAGASNYLNIPGLTVSGLGNNFLSWETQTTINFGLDYAVLQGRITGSVDVYRRRSTDMLLSRNLPNTSGYGSIRENVGALDNRGIEIAIDGAVINTGTFRWNTNFNIAFQDQELLNLFEGQTNNGASQQVGHPLNLWVGARWAGVNPATGRPMYYDRNGEITYQPTSGSTLGDEMDDRVILGNSNSDFFGGWLNTFTYKNWTFDFMFQYDYGKRGTDGTGSFSYNPYEMRLNLYNRLNDITWSNPGDIVSMPRPNTQAELGAIGVGIGRTLQDLSYIRLKQVSLAYMVPQQYLQRIGVSTMKFYAQGINLWTLDRFTGLDVEFTGGTSTGIFPPAKNYTIGVQFGF